MIAPRVTKALPPEVLDIVLDNLHPSGSTSWAHSWATAQQIRQPLSACTLISRSWFYIAQEHLFRDVVYSFQRSPASDAEEWNVPDAPSRWSSCPPIEWRSVEHASAPLKTLHMFFDFLQQSPIIRRHIRRLRLACYPTLDNETWNWGTGYIMEDKDAVSSTLLVSLLTSLPRPEHLQTWNVFVPSPLTTHALDEHIFMREVCIDYEDYSSTPLRACGLLTCFEKVENLSICRPTYHPVREGRDWNDELTDDFPLSTSLDVESLTMATVYNDPPLLVIHEFMCRSHMQVQNVVQTLGSRLECFEITFLEPSKYPVYYVAFDLSPMRKLRELVIGMICTTKKQPVVFLETMQEQSLSYFLTMELSPNSNPELQKYRYAWAGEMDGINTAADMTVGGRI